MTRFIFTDAYENRLRSIEDYLYQSTQSLAAIEQFLDEHDRVLGFIEHNPTAPAVHPSTGDQSWVFGEGRYRLFFRVVTTDEETRVYLTHIIDNRQANLDVYPGNSLPTYPVDE